MKSLILLISGGRKGPIYYDVASFIWQAKANYSEELKDELLETYLKALKQFIPVDEKHFTGSCATLFCSAPAGAGSLRFSWVF